MAFFNKSKKKHRATEGYSRVTDKLVKGVKKKRESLQEIVCLWPQSQGVYLKGEINFKRFIVWGFHFILICIYSFIFHFMATPLACGRSWARDWIRATAVTYCWSCGSTRSFNPLHQAGDWTRTSAAILITAVKFFIHCATAGTP